MVGVLLDTCVISEVKSRRGLQVVKDAVNALDARQIFLSVVTIGELRKGVELAEPAAFRRRLSTSLDSLEQMYSDQVLPIDMETAHIWGDLTARAKLRGFQVPVTDGLIAATALRHGLTVMTRNTRDFAATGALIFDPWPENGR